ncbi:hypothetical protein ACSSVY_000784 [Roseovarius sp. MBR-51]
MECAPFHGAVNALRADTEGPLPAKFERTVCADIVALDQTLVYNRFGSFNPFGMMYALRRDVVSADSPIKSLTADDCDALTGVESGIPGQPQTLRPGDVRLKDCKRPRPLTLRANVGDILHLRLTNLLRPLEPGVARPGNAPDLSRDFCKETDPSRFGQLFAVLHDWVSWGSDSEVSHGEATCVEEPVSTGVDPAIGDPNWPLTRGANLAIQGLTAFRLQDGALVEAADACKGLAAIPPGEAIDCYYMVEHEGPYFMASTGAPAGGQGDGGSLVHGLFGAVVAERQGSAWYRSQLTSAGFDLAFRRSETSDRPHARRGDDIMDHSRFDVMAKDEAGEEEIPVLAMLKQRGRGAFELVHGDLNAIIHIPDAPDESFREFSVFFHDELKTFYPRNFEELGDFAGGQLAGVRDGFAINYGASGMGDMLLANRKGIGPAANCQECLYEEFFLTSWANGDPALLEQFSDDPSNVHHSYLNDRVVFRNFHAGPKETHVFHLHAHQWFAGNDGGRGSYLDSQTVGPQQGFSYDIYGGGTEIYHRGEGDAPGWFETLGSGNRNRTVGDSIFHCHLYPHFAQGMWELWRVHDVLEDGTRKLPDGQWEPALSLAEMSADTRAKKRPGSVDPATGRLIVPGADLEAKNIGTPVPALVPLPGQAWPVLPSYAEDTVALQTDGTLSKPAEIVAEATPSALKAFPGYPFYIAGKPGHRPPQAPMDLARELEEGSDDVTDGYLDGGLPRHVMTDDSTRKLPFELPQAAAERLGKDVTPTTLAEALTDSDLRDREALQNQVVAAALALGDLTLKLETATLDLLPYDGTALERSAMAFHHRGEADGVVLDIVAADGSTAAYDATEGGYVGADGRPFAVNSSAPKPGAPFADPCGAPLALGTLIRQEAGSYVWIEGGSEEPVFTDAALTVPATDRDVTHWVHRERPTTDPRPDFFVAGRPDPLPRDTMVREQDPFLSGLETLAGFGDTAFTPDPAVVGYRRYEASAVQVDMVTNRAGWHDPQARINVLTDRSDGYKTGDGKISPKVTASEEPFFFRALSGECIEFRHTNELPKDLELDDFQVKTPTDTIGQHIHLVKFDVTSSDGSGNGFNYEDGTMAPGEVAARICAAKNTATAANVTENRTAGVLMIREFPGLCSQDSEGHWHVADQFYKKIWQLPMQDKTNDRPNRDLFQTTTQRWFADPILSDMRRGNDEAGRTDRTLRTVFSHDHFGPSSIQQHGFYTALVIEPQSAMICDESSTDCTDPRSDRSLVVASDDDVGARKVIVDLHPVTAREPNLDDAAIRREFAVSIADFATLYDPRAAISERQFEAELAAENEVPFDGMATLLCEARHAASPEDAAKFCGSPLDKDATGWHGAAGEMVPAWVAEGHPDDAPDHQQGMEPGFFTALRIDDHGTLLAPDAFLDHYVKDYRAKAAGYDSHTARGARLAKPVAPPSRPESISVDHHDPYLVNYRGEPFPLRVGTDSSSGSDCALKPLGHWVGALGSGVTETCEISEQKPDESGDFANVLRSEPHDDPVVPILNSFDEEALQFRLIQGAQEVQHTFNIEGYTWTRNIDQRFPSMMRELDDNTRRRTLVRACYETPGNASGLRIAREGRPEEYHVWMNEGLDAFALGSAERLFWSDIETFIATCFNVDGRVAAQEIGISEHFEFAAAFHEGTNVPYTPRMLIAPPPLADNGDEHATTTVNDIQRNLRARLDEIATFSDTPYHFGTQDAQWNGAWGLVRVRRLPAIEEEVDDYRRDLSDLLRDFSRVDRSLTLDRLRADPRNRLLADRFGDLTLRDPRLIPRPRPMPSPSPAVELMPPRGAETEDEDIRRVQQATALVPLETYRTDPFVVDRVTSAFGADAAQSGPSDRPGRGTPSPGEDTIEMACDAAAPRVHTAIAAIEVEDVFDSDGVEGTAYSEELSDPDGLFFALIDPRRLLNPRDPASVTPDRIRDPNQWTGIRRNAVIDAIRLAYDRPEPLVMHVKAGDCVHVTVINALTYENDGPRQDNGDQPGDARMPGITSINTDPDWDPAIEGGNTPIITTLVADSRRKDVKPSARLAVSLPLPIMTNQSNYARPFGENPLLALSGTRASETNPQLSMRGTFFMSGDPNMEQFEFYAGLASGKRADPNAISGQSAPSLVLGNLAPSLRTVDLPLQSGSPVRVDDLVSRISTRTNAVRTLARDVETLSDSGPERLNLSGGIAELSQEMEILGADMETLGRDVQAIAADNLVASQLAVDLAQLGLAVDFKPYAFGAVPLKSFGDLIGHPTHGLIGAVTVAPKGAQLSEERVVRTTLAGCDRLIFDPATLRPVMRQSIAEKLGIDLARTPFGRNDINDLRIRLNRCQDYVLVPRARPEQGTGIQYMPLASTLIKMKGLGEEGDHSIRQFTLFWQDGLHMRDRASANRWRLPSGLTVPQFEIPDLTIPEFEPLRPEIGRLPLRDLLPPDAVERLRGRLPEPTLGALSEAAREDPSAQRFLRLIEREDLVRVIDDLRIVPRPRPAERIVWDCAICDDTYDFGEAGISYKSEPFDIRLRDWQGNKSGIERHYDFNPYEFGSGPASFFRLSGSEDPRWPSSPVPVLRVIEGEELVIHVVHPGGRARQRALTTFAQSYDDLFPGFGFPNAALLAPGKALTASVRKTMEEGCYLFGDGPTQIRGSGVWGLIDVVSTQSLGGRPIESSRQSSCMRARR